MVDLTTYQLLEVATMDALMAAEKTIEAMAVLLCTGVIVGAICLAANLRAEYRKDRGI